MMKNIYAAAWFVLALAVIVSLFTGSFTAGSLFVYSLIALVLVYGLALQAVFVQTRNADKSPRK